MDCQIAVKEIIKNKKLKDFHATGFSHAKLRNCVCDKKRTGVKAQCAMQSKPEITPKWSEFNLIVFIILSPNLKLFSKQ
jgi:hypothetical protein|tara:strand:- start:7170 stop:7406 length:237 start_codon:yes stop_codon:yes gene_type:complete